MRSVTVILFCFTFMFIPIITQGQDTGYIFQTPDEDHATWCIFDTPMYTADVWFWAISSFEGLIGAEFDVQYPSNVIADTLIINEAIVDSTVGSLPGGIRIYLHECQKDIVWLCRQTIHVTDLDRAATVIVGHPETGLSRLSTCEEGYPYKTCWTCSLLVNYDPLTSAECSGFEPYGLPCTAPVGVDNSTWGTIKAIYK